MVESPVTWIMLPAFNEEVALKSLLPKIHQVFNDQGRRYRIVVVNDGSTDNSQAILDQLAQSIHLDVVTHCINRGLGETERDGFEYIAARCSPMDSIVRLDCDDTHEPSYIFCLLDKLDEGFDVVIASRFQEGGGQVGVNAYRATISYLANLFMKVLFNIPQIREYSCGYRAYRAKAIQSAVLVFGNGFIQLKGLGFTSTLETIVKLKLLGCSFAEVPFVLRYDKKTSVSKMISSVTTLGYFTMAILYHWPWGGWRYFYGNLAETYQKNPEYAVNAYRPGMLKRSSVCRIGGG
ncbi:MAG: glycosyltransferase family 2 protein [Sporomusaceae bacterium]|nr:glycosyltransferase family 2 protein [Sporomusaceae bacterium]